MIINPKTKNNSRQNGFTLIELLVAMSLFVIIVTIAVGSFISAMRTQRALVALMAVNDNASLAIEQMAREIRTGTEFCVDPPNPGCVLDSNNGKLVFTNYRGEQIIYQLGTKTVSGDNIGILQKGTQQITADNVNVQNLKFIVSGNQSNDNYPPKITIILKVAVPPKGAIGVGGVATNLQTTISARNLE